MWMESPSEWLDDRAVRSARRIDQSSVDLSTSASRIALAAAAVDESHIVSARMRDSIRRTKGSIGSHDE